MNIAIFGAGSVGECLYKTLVEKGITIQCWLDDNRAGTHKFSLPVISTEHADKSLTVYIALTPSVKIDPQQQVNRLLSLGFKAVYHFFEYIEQHPEFFKHYFATEHLWMRSQSTQMLNYQELDWLAQRLADHTSRDVLMRLIEFRSEQSAIKYPFPDGQVEYLAADVPLPEFAALRFIDCGAYIGDTLYDLVAYSEKKRIKQLSVLSFEPDPRNYRRLQRAVCELKGAAPDAQFITWPACVWHRVETLNFSDDATSSASLNSAGHSRIQAIDLDSCCYGFAPNFIKMDIEGAEQQALKGASKIIKAFKPLLAICVYHTPSDLWQIPRFIDQLDDQYHFYLRLHEHMGLSTVLYCVPGEAPHDTSI